MKLQCKLTRETFILKEPLVKDYKNLLKGIYGEEINPDLFLEVLYEFLDSVTDKPIEWIKNLSCIDLFCFLVETRILCAGDICEIVIKDKQKQKPKTVNLNLKYIQEDLQKIAKERICITKDNLTIELDYPSLERINERTTEDFLLFFKRATITQDNTTNILEINTNKEAGLLVEQIDPNLFLQCMNYITNMTDRLFNLNFLSRYRIEDPKIIFIPTIDTLVWFTKLIFNESLEAFFNNFFYLSYSAHMNSSYLETITVGEFTYFVSCLRKVLNQGKEGQESTSTPEAADGFDDEFMQ